MQRTMQENDNEESISDVSEVDEIASMVNEIPNSKPLTKENSHRLTTPAETVESGESTNR